MSSRALVVFLLLPLVACDGGLDAYGDGRATGDVTDQGWWWLWPTTDDADEEAEPPVPAEPGDPEWFDAHCADGVCVVSDDFDPRDHLEAAHALCQDAMALEEGPWFDVLWFETDRVYTDEFRASAAHWTYRFVAPDPNDLWGYQWLECEVDVNGQTVELDTGYASDSRRAVRVDALQQGLVYGLDHALEDLGSWNHVTRGGFQWHQVDAEPELFLSDDQYNDWDSWNAVTGEQD
ncbi:MAG: hypothetical protein R3F61_21785 [Myxococcota bacterium]